MKSIISFAYQLKPIFLAGELLVYLLGVGISRYLGSGLDTSLFWVGLLWILALHLATVFLLDFFDHRTPEERGLNSGSGDQDGLLARRKRAGLLLAFASLAALASLTVVIITQVKPSPVVFLWMALGFLGGYSYSVPPLRLADSAYGELLLAFIIGFLIPAFAFTFQAGALHRLVAMTTFPLVIMCLGTQFALDFSHYASDLRRVRSSLVIQMGWKTAVNGHNLLILSAYLGVGLASLFGMPRFAAMAALLSLPVGLLQIWQMWRISQGGKPIWNLLKINALGTFASMAYLFTYSYWTH